MPNAAALSLEAQAGAPPGAVPRRDASCGRCSRRWSTRRSTRLGWLWEPKLDGVRTLAFIATARWNCAAAAAWTRRRPYPTSRRLLARSRPQTMVLDGEICALDESGVPRFELLQPRINLTRGADIAADGGRAAGGVYFVFDLLYLDGYDLRAVPLKRAQAAARGEA